MKFCGDYYDIYEHKRIYISNASWEILKKNVKNMFVFSILQTVSGTSTLSKVIEHLDVLYNWKTIFWIKHVNFKLP